MMTYDEMIAVIAAHKEGKQIECKTKYDVDARWIEPCHIENGNFNFSAFDYRIKPEPLVLWGLYKPDGSFYGTYRTLESAQDDKKYHDLRYPQCDHLTPKKFVEVTE